MHVALLRMKLAQLVCTAAASCAAALLQELAHLQQQLNNARPNGAHNHALCQLNHSRVAAGFEFKPIRVHAQHQEEVHVAHNALRQLVLLLVATANVLSQLRKQHPGSSAAITVAAGVLGRASLNAPRCGDGLACMNQPVSQAVHAPRDHTECCTTVDSPPPCVLLTCRLVHLRACWPHT